MYSHKEKLRILIIEHGYEKITTDFGISRRTVSRLLNEDKAIPAPYSTLIDYLFTEYCASCENPT